MKAKAILFGILMTATTVCFAKGNSTQQHIHIHNHHNHIHQHHHHGKKHHGHRHHRHHRHHNHRQVQPLIMMQPRPIQPQMGVMLTPHRGHLQPNFFLSIGF